MPDETTIEDDEPINLVHDDIMKRLVAYQRRLGAGATGEQAAGAFDDGTAPDVGSTPDRIVDLTAAEAGARAANQSAGSPEVDDVEVAGRFAALENTLANVARELQVVRTAFQDVVVSADERLAVIQREVEDARAELSEIRDTTAISASAQ